MPKTKETSNHPCHFLSLPSAKRFWCRHCMSVFEDAITRWRHSRSCRYGVVNNFMRRRQLEAKALQNTTKPNPIEARLEQSVSPSEEPIVEEIPGPSSSTSSEPSISTVKTNQATSNDLFRCFICHNKFSTLEEMRHHVKYPCNNKKIVTDVPNPAVTVYIDEFTDRSRQWEPQPQTEEVITSEFVPNVMSQETVPTNMELKSESSGNSNTINISTNKESGTNITPTNIYVNEQGETVIEVENLDLNSEGGELSLAHLLTQLSQQGIVFDKNKASQMQAHHEVATISDPESGEVYATTTTYDPSARTSLLVKEEDESQSTAEDAANTLAQLAVFRGGYNRINQDFVDVPQSSVTTELQRQYVVEGVSSEGYTYTESYTMPHFTNATSDHQISINDDLKNDIKVEYQYLPTGQTITSDSQSTPQISIQPSSILDHSSVTAHHLGSIEVVREDIDNTGSNSHQIQIQQNQMQPQVVTYITPSSSSSTIQHVQASQAEAMMIEDFVVEHSGDAQQHYHQEEIHHQQHPANISVSVSADGIVQTAESYNHSQHQAHEHTTIPTALVEAGQNSYIVFNSEDNSTQIICDSTSPGNGNGVIVNGSTTSVPGTSILNNEMIENHIREQERLRQLQQSQTGQIQQLQENGQEMKQEQIQQEHVEQIEEEQIQHTQQEHVQHIQQEEIQHIQQEDIQQMQQEEIQQEHVQHIQQEHVQHIQQEHVQHIQQEHVQHIQQENVQDMQQEHVQHIQQEHAQHIQQERVQYIQQEHVQHIQHEQLQQHEDQLQLPITETREHANEAKGTDDFEVQTVTLQEIADTETTETAPYAVQNHTTTETVTPIVISTDGIANSSSSDNNNTDSNSSLQLKQTFNDSYAGNNIHLDVNQQTAINIASTSMGDGNFTTVTVGDQQESSLGPEESAVTSEPEISSDMPVYVVSSHGGLQLVTPSSNLMQQQQEHPSQ